MTARTGQLGQNNRDWSSVPAALTGQPGLVISFSSLTGQSGKKICDKNNLERTAGAGQFGKVGLPYQLLVGKPGEDREDRPART
jgi:hypothetical protein